MKIYKSILILIFLAFLFSSPPVSAKFLIDVDYSVFRYNNEKSTLELYFAFYQNSLKYINVNNRFEASVFIDVDIADNKTSKSVFKNTYNMPSVLADTTHENLSQKLIGQLNFNLQEGNYGIRIIGTDANLKTNSDTITINTSIPLFLLDRTQISDVQVASSIEKSGDSKSLFYKNGLEITPNPNSLFGKNITSVYFYYEIYGISTDFPGDNSYIISYIENLSGDIIMKEEKNIKSKSDAFAQIGEFKRVDTLKSGKYFLKVKLYNKELNREIVKEKQIFIFSSATDISLQVIPDEEQEFMRSKYAVMKEKNVDDDFDRSIYIRTQTETNEYNKLKKLDEKRKFMFRFWRKRDETPVTPFNEYQVNYYKRIAEANKMFSESYSEGWRTDRGRIYITYGKPDEIEKYPFESDKRSYEVWRYLVVQGGALCVFIERVSETGIYTLEHSTLRGEPRNDNWERLLVRIKRVEEE